MWGNTNFDKCGYFFCICFIPVNQCRITADNALILHFFDFFYQPFSCVEFFSIPAGDGIYYNIECNCIGTILIGAGPARNGREHAPKEVTALVQRWSSLGNEPFEERVDDTTWEVALIIPYAAFFKHQIQSLDGKEVKANFYKCGDELQTPHFLSWNPIKIEKPDFHRPDFFGTLEFE